MRLPLPVLAQLHAADPSETWPGLVAADPSVRARVEQMLDTASNGLGEALLLRLRKTGPGVWHGVRAALWSDQLAVAAGAEFVRTTDGPGLLYATRSGAAVRLAPLSFRTLRHLGGPPQAIARVVSALETVLLPHRFAIYLRQPLPVNADPSAIVAAAFGWIRDVERGQASRYATFDDDDAGLHLDLDLFGDDVAGRPGLWFIVPPSRGPEWLGLIDRRLQHLFSAHTTDEPLIPVLCADPQWSLGRGFVGQWLYGTPNIVSVEPPSSASIEWPHDDTGLFCDPAAKQVPAIWWLEAFANNPLAMRGWSHANPWAEAVDLKFPGARLAQHGPGVALSWDMSPPTVWESP